MEVTAKKTKSFKQEKNDKPFQTLRIEERMRGTVSYCVNRTDPGSCVRIWDTER
jgi:hypothetical protein